MDFSMLFKRAGKVAAENSPAILTALGVSGTLTTAYLAAKAAFQSVDVLREAEDAKEAEFLGTTLQIVEEEPEVEGIKRISYEPLTTQEKVEAVWKLYAPAAASAALTIAAIILAARVQERRNAALLSAYTTVEKSYQEYRAKNVETLGKKKEQDLRDKLAQESVDREPPGSTEIYIMEHGNILCRDAYSGRYFDSTHEKVQKAEIAINYQILNEDYASLTDFWDILGLDPTKGSDNLGWTTERPFEIAISWTGTKDKKPCMVVGFRNDPEPHFYKGH